MEYTHLTFTSIDLLRCLRLSAKFHPDLLDLAATTADSEGLAVLPEMSRRSNLVPVMSVGQAAGRQLPKTAIETTKSTFRPRQMNRTLLMMPDDILTMVLSLLTYDEISQLRVVRKTPFPLREGVNLQLFGEGVSSVWKISNMRLHAKEHNK